MLLNANYYPMNDIIPKQTLAHHIKWLFHEYSRIFQIWN